MLGGATTCSASSSSRPLKILIDSNVFIALEDHGSSSAQDSPKAAEFQRLSSALGFQMVLATATPRDLLNARDPLRSRREKQLEKYVVLHPVPQDPALARTAGFPTNRSPNDERDLDILQALAVKAADWLVTEDVNLRKRASRAGYTDTVFSLSEAVDTLKSFLRVPSELPAVETLPGYQVSLRAQIFDSIRSDYPNFDAWWQTKVALEHRDVLVLGNPEEPDGVAVLKIETDRPHGLTERVLKLCTFKIADRSAGSRQGELLLKAAIDYARQNQCNQIYVEVLPSKETLIGWLADFGFADGPGSSTPKGEHVLVKDLVPLQGLDTRDPLAYNIRYGPGAILVDRAHVVPIRAEWHRRLLPEAERQLALFPRAFPCGNAIRKAYLCHAPTRKVKGGDALVFYRTDGSGQSLATSIGVAESAIVSSVPDEIIAFVGNRTVYTSNEIELLCSRGAVLAIRFRFDRVLSPFWSKAVMQTAGIAQSTIRSIRQIQREGLQWIQQQLAAPS